MQITLWRPMAGLALAVALAACGATPATPLGLNGTPSGPTAVSPAPSSPRVTLSPSASPFAASTIGDFRLELRLAKLAWAAGEPMTGEAELIYLGSSPMNLVGAGSGLIVFNYVEVGGRRQLLGVSTADCAPHDITAGTPITAPLVARGGYDTADPSNAWIGQAMSSQGVRLPAGTWDVTAQAEFTENACDGPRYTLETTVRVVIGG